MELIIYGLAILSLFITLGAQAFISSSYSKYSKVKNKKGYTGKEVARLILDKHGLTDIKVEETGGYLSDHYDPTKRVIRLSKKIYNDYSIASVAVACHECGHAIQDKEGYSFLRIRSMLVPIVNLCSYAGYFAILFGSILSMFGLVWVGIIAEMVILLFQLITLPVEFNASRRGLKEVKDEMMLTNDEYNGGKIMLTSAALTYVASLATTIIEVLRLILIFGRNDD